MSRMIRIALVCTFSNAKVREHLPLGANLIYGLARKILHLPAKKAVCGDMAGWVTYMIENLRKRNDIVLFVICSHSGMTRRTVSFELEGVHYYFLKCEYATSLKYIIKSPSLWHRLNPMRPLVRRIIKRVKPDLIALIGAENPHISGTVLGIKGIPLIVKCQTIYNNPQRRKTGAFDEKNAYVEKLLFNGLRYVSVNTKMHERMFREVNKTAFNFTWEYGNLMPEVKQVEKVYDFVIYAAGMSARKGYPDAIQALAIVKRHYHYVRLNVVGGGSEDYKKELEELAKKMGVSDNIVFTPFLEKQVDLFQHIQQARFALLPCKLDYIASTIRQAMHYELPVVCYKTEGTITLNEEKPCVLTADNSNVEDLATKMLMLLDDHSVAEVLRKNAKEYSSIWNDDERITNQMVGVFNAVVNHYNNGITIPSELLYTPKA